MKTVKITLSLIVGLAFFGLNEAMGQWNTSGTNIYNTNTGNVGIGNSTPSSLLYVAKNMTEPTITVRNLGGTGGASFRMWDNASGADWKFKATLTGGFKIRDNAYGLDVIVIEPNGAANALYIKQGKVGIGEINPTHKLTVNSSQTDGFALRLIGPLGYFGHGAKLDFGDIGYTMIQEDEDDKLQIHAAQGVRITGGNVGIGTLTPNSSAKLEVSSDNQGFLPPRMTTTQRNAIQDPAEGLLIFNLTTGCLDYYFGGMWKSFCGSASEFTCGTSITKSHIAGSVAPVTKTVTYGTVTNIPGEPTKCWITSNLGADHQATAVNDATESSAGWYWQFNRMQGYKHDGTTVTPAWTITWIDENSDLLTANDPCALLLGTGWRLPTTTEWTNVKASGGWTDWNGPWSSALKMHAAGYLGYSDGSLNYRGSNGYYWSSFQYDSTTGWNLYFNSGHCHMYDNYKANGFSARCLRD